MAPHSGQRSILQYMVPWLANMELVEENQTSPYIAHSTAGHASWPRPSSAVLQGTGWGSLDGTKLVLHNLLYITAKVYTDWRPFTSGYSVPRAVWRGAYCRGGGSLECPLLVAKQPEDYHELLGPSHVCLWEHGCHGPACQEDHGQFQSQSCCSYHH